MNIDASALMPGSRQTIYLSPYQAYNLEPITSVKLHPRADGTIHPGDLKAYHDIFKDDWKMQEGGILYCLGDSRAFWNCLISYHGPTKSTGIKEWDALFHKLQSTGYPKNIIPCMVRVFTFCAWNLISRPESFLDEKRDAWTKTVHFFMTVTLYSPTEPKFSLNDAKRLILKSHPNNALHASACSWPKLDKTPRAAAHLCSRKDTSRWRRTRRMSLRVVQIQVV